MIFFLREEKADCHIIKCAPKKPTKMSFEKVDGRLSQMAFFLEERGAEIKEIQDKSENERSSLWPPGVNTQVDFTKVKESAKTFLCSLYERIQLFLN